MTVTLFTLTLATAAVYTRMSLLTDSGPQSQLGPVVCRKVVPLQFNSVLLTHLRSRWYAGAGIRLLPTPIRSVRTCCSVQPCRIALYLTLLLFIRSRPARHRPRSSRVPRPAPWACLARVDTTAALAATPHSMVSSSSSTPPSSRPATTRTPSSMGYVACLDLVFWQSNVCYFRYMFPLLLLLLCKIFGWTFLCTYDLRVAYVHV